MKVKKRIHEFEEELQLFYKFFDLKSFLIMAFMISFWNHHSKIPAFTRSFYCSVLYRTRGSSFYGRSFVYLELYKNI